MVPLTSTAMKTSEGGPYRAFFKKGSENNVMLYFAGGGVSVNEETARQDTYNTTEPSIDALANLTMNMGGLASGVEGSPFANWSVILFPYARATSTPAQANSTIRTATGRKRYSITRLYKLHGNDATGHALAGINAPEAVVVTGYSAGGFAAALLADDVFSNYFPTRRAKTCWSTPPCCSTMAGTALPPTYGKRPRPSPTN